MPDAVPVPREEIERFIRDRGVTRCPSPSFLAPPTASDMRRMERQLAEAEERGELDWKGNGPSNGTGTTWSEQSKATYKRQSLNLKAKHAARRARYAELVDRGLTAEAIAPLMGVQPETVRSHCRIHGLKLAGSEAPQPAPPPPPEPDKPPLKKTRIIEMIQAGFMATEIAEAVDCKTNMVYRIACKVGLKCKRAPRPGPPPSPTSKKVAALHAEGKTAREIMAELGLNKRQAYGYLTRLKLKPHPPGRGRPC